MVQRHGFDDNDDTGNVCWVQADLRVSAEAIAGAEKVTAAFVAYGRPLALNSEGPVKYDAYRTQLLPYAARLLMLVVYSFVDLGFLNKHSG